MKLEKTVIDSSKGIGLVLSGGGARGAYQAGVIKALTELGLKFNLIAGTSVGALNAAFVAAGKVDKMVEIWENINLFQVLSFNPMTFINGSLLSNKPLEKLIRREINEESIQRIIDYSVKLMIISSNLKTEEAMIYQNFKNYGEIIDAVLASSAIPVAFPYLKIYEDKEKNERLMQLIDGGIIDNFPLKKAIETGLCKTFFTISLYTPESKRPEDKEKYNNSLMGIAMRTLDTFYTSSYVREIKDVKEKIELANDLKKIINKNFSPFKSLPKEIENLYSKNKCEFYEGLQIIETNSCDELPSELGFDSDKTQNAIKLGYEDAFAKSENIKII